MLPQPLSPASPTELIRRVEEASLNAWPATHQLIFDGWLIRMSNGFTKRANCVVPLYDNSDSAAAAGRVDELLAKVRYCENLYAREQLRTTFRLKSQPASSLLDSQLEQRGYRFLDKTRVLTLRLNAEFLQTADSQNPQFRLVPAGEWLEIYAGLSAMPKLAGDLHATLIRAIRPDCAFGVIEVEQTPVACALAVLEHDLVGLFDVITHPEQRRSGHARALMAALLHWGAQQGASRAYLQVVADNQPALALYEKMGFEDLYNYWYRQSK